jgi:hypothetical protein
VIPTPEQLEEISRLHEGTLTEVPFAALLLGLAVHRRTLLLEVRRKQMSKKVVLEAGVPIDCRSNLVHETLGRFLVAGGKLPAEDLHSYLGQSASRGQPLGEVLLDHGVVTAEELWKQLQQNLAKKVLDIFTWRDGEFRTHAEVPRPQSSLKIRVPQLIVTGITKFAPQEEVEAGVVPLVGKKLCLHPDPPFALDEIRLNSRQSQLAVALRSGWRIDELALGTGMPFEEITRLLYALALLGVVITADHPAAKAAPRAANLAAAMPAPVPDPAATADAAAASPAAAPAAPSAAAAVAAPATAAVPGPPALEAPAPSAPAAAGGAEAATAHAAAAAPATPAAAGGTPEAASPPPLKELTVTRPMPTLRPVPPSARPAGGAATSPVGTLPAAAALDAAASPASPRRAVDAPDLAGVRNEIMQAYLSYRRLDAFDLLGADEDASPAAVEGRYLEFARRFAPWSLGGPELADMEEQARDLFLAGARAYAELLDLEQRNAVLYRRKARREERDRRAPSDLLAIKTDLLDPEVQYRKGRALMDAGKFQEAALLLEFAADCDPQNGLYSAELAYCRFCLAPGQGAKALKELQETLRRDPDCGLAVYYSGEVHRHMGNHEEAEKTLRRAIKMMAPDRRPIEALKALSADRRR